MKLKVLSLIALNLFYISITKSLINCDNAAEFLKFWNAVTQDTEYKQRKYRRTWTILTILEEYEKKAAKLSQSISEENKKIAQEIYLCIRKAKDKTESGEDRKFFEERFGKK